ncbi:unnamed protein product [Miscanthus lutarioriparius]|uniref:DDE Tnp4 domain-containing protein n=1 Tax=Miscanthus lutarioriparius TaxID=422564 RepID=A0A811MVX1_9POAL|nr:unnamed protein product [Miscanthus lutarioriparius]
MRFTYVGAGRAGASHDMSVPTECLETPTYPHLAEGKYYLVDSGYAVKKGYLDPYRNARYHLDEFRDSAAPTSYEEQFNFRHSSLRNVIEWAFGRLKGK